VEGDKEENNDEDIAKELQDIADQDGANKPIRETTGELVELQQVQQLEELP
jgi:hypothetical protein